MLLEEMKQEVNSSKYGVFIGFEREHIKMLSANFILARGTVYKVDDHQVVRLVNKLTTKEQDIYLVVSKMLTPEEYKEMS